MTAEAAAELTSADALVRVHDVAKAFAGTVALKGVSLDLHAHHVHAIVGENGAGKSTLIKVITGAHRPDSGSLEIDGKSYSSLTASQARDLGIAAIYQEFTLLPQLSVAENVFLGAQPRSRIGLIDVRARARRARQFFEELGIEIDVLRPVGELTVAEQQIVEIAKALSLDARVLIMDEPSAVLPTHDLDRLFAIIRRLREDGASIVYISHRLDEVFEIADDVVVLKDGASVGQLDVANTSRRQLVELMVGRPFSEFIPPSTATLGEVVLKVDDLCVDECVWNVSFEVREGEIVGLAGLGGSGRTTLARSLVGLAHINKGRISIDGGPGPRNPTHAASLGVVLVPEDRARFGLALEKSLTFNISLPALRALSHLGVFLSQSREREMVDAAIDRLDIRARRSSDPVASLSGGNQQKVVLAKWLSMRPKVVVLDEPTRGIDIGAKAEVYRLIRELTTHGVAVVVASSDLPELLGLSDRVVVLHEGVIAGELPATDASETAVVHLATGAGAEEPGPQSEAIDGH